MHIAAVLALTWLNIPESARFKKGAFRIWGRLPKMKERQQKMKEHLKVRFALEPLKCIRLALASVNLLPPCQHSMFLSPGIRSPPPSHRDRDTTLTHINTAARPPSTVAAAVASVVVSAAAVSAAAIATAPTWARTCVIRCWFYLRCCLSGLVHVTLLSISRGSMIRLLRSPATITAYTRCW
jgi:hypothetical protein